MSLLKRFSRSRAATAIACWLLARYIRLVELTTRWSLRGFDPMHERLARDEPFITAFWHGRMVLIPGLWRRVGKGRTAHMLVSLHRDGRLISRVIGHLGVRTIAGSTSRGGGAALRSLVRVVKAGHVVGITPDGPRGPRMHASTGVAGAASLSGVPVFAVSCAATRRRLFGSWDRFMLPLPFGRAVVVSKGPFEVPRDADAATLEAARKRIEAALNEATREADEACGLDPVEPAPALPADPNTVVADQ